MTDLITRLKKLSGPNPVVQVKLTADDAEAVERLVEDAERWKTLMAIATKAPNMIVSVENSDSSPYFIHHAENFEYAIDSARTPTKETT